MDATVEPWLDLWDYLDRNFWGFWQWAAAHLTPEQACWQPTQRVASIGWNLQHLGEMLDHYLSRVFDQGDRVQATPLLTMVPGNLDTGRYRDLQAIALYHQKVRPAYRALLERLTATDLDRRLVGSVRAKTWAWAIGHIAEHESYHLGKCTLLRNLLPEARL